MSNIINLYKKIIPDKQWNECDELSKRVAIFVLDNVTPKHGRLFPVVLAMALGRAKNTLENMGIALDEEELKMINILSTGKGLK